MKLKSLLCSALTISVFAFGSASAFETSLGIKAGVNLANLHGKVLDESKIKAGLSVGAALQVKLMDMLAVQPELLFAQKGFKSTSTGATGTTTSKITLNYLEIPVLAQLLAPSPIPFVSPMVYAGPSFSIKLGKPSLKIEGQKVDLGNTFSNFDFGIAFGGAIGIQFGPGKAVADIRYTLGLTNLEKNFKEKNGALTLGAAYMLPL